MSIIDIIIKKRLKYEQRLGSILYRTLAPLKLVIIVGVTVLILRFIFSGNLLENTTAITILTIMIIVGIIYSFDFLYVILYVIAKKSSKSQVTYKRAVDGSIRKMVTSKRKMEKYKHEMEESKHKLEQIELMKEKELSSELEQIPRLIEEKQFLIVKDKLEKILQESKQYHLNIIQANAQAEYNKYKKFWK